MRMSSSITRVGLSCLPMLAPLFGLGCNSSFNTDRQATPTGSLGHTLYGVVCDRVGAQSLPTDVTGSSFTSICHPDPVTGQYTSKVNVSLLPPLQNPAYTADGVYIPLSEEEASRTYEIARVEALGRDRESVAGALDSTLPDTTIPVLSSSPVACVANASTATVSLQAEIGATLGRLTDLYDDTDQTIPSVTRALGRSLNDIKTDPDVQASLVRFDARQGYRPISTALGMVRPLLSYPRLVELTRNVITPMLSVTGQGEGPEALAYDALLQAGYQELRTPPTAASSTALTSTIDPALAGRTVLSRPRTLLEETRDILSLVKPDFSIGAADYVVQRDSRGYAAVPLVNGLVPAPFVDANADGLPDVNPLGEFVTSTGSPAVSPFFTPEGTDGPRDQLGRAMLSPSSGALMYGYVDAYSTALAALARDAQPFFAPGVAANKETAMNAIAALPVLAGTRDTDATSLRQYPPDPYAVGDWKAGHTGSPPAGLGTLPVSLPYRAFHPETSPIVHLAYALGQVLPASEMDDLLALVQNLFANQPNQLANLMGLALEIRAIAAKHPEATMPVHETLWDDALLRLGPVAHESGLLEDILRGFADPQTLPLEQVLKTFVSVKDDVSYDTNDLNGPSIDLSTGVAPPNFTVPVDRTQPDVGANRSELQKFLSLLHDTNGLSICTKDGAIVHINGLQSVLPIPVPVSFNYPADTSDATAPNLISAAMCAIFGSTAPAHLNKCAVFGYQNVMSLLLDVLLNKALLQVNDPCLNTLMTSSFVKSLGDGSQYGGANKFLQAISGVTGFSLQPDLRGFARLLYFETPYPGLPTDTNALGINLLTNNFLSDTIDPIPSMVCDPTPFTLPDGRIFPLRTCKTTDDMLRARDKDALFPVDELGFVSSLQPLATAFDKHNQPLLFADLFDVLHLHWGSTSQPATVCNPTLPHSDPRWSAQDNLVSYEPLLAEVLQNGVFARLQAFLTAAAGVTVNHCTTFDPQSHLCTQSVKYDGIHVLGQALSYLLDPARTPGLVDWNGSAFAQRNDGQQTDPMTGLDLLIEAMTGIDSAFDDYASANPNDTGRHTQWLAARSNFVDTFLSVNGQGTSANFANSTLIEMVPTVLQVLREQVAANCTPGVPCAWAQHDLVANLSDSMSGPTFAGVLDLVDALRQDANAKNEIEQLVTYLLGTIPGSSNPTALDARAGVIAAALDVLGILQDNTNLPPFERALARAVEPPVTDDSGKVVARSVGDAAVRALSKMFELRVTGTGADACATERDPNRVLGYLLQNLVTPRAADELTPLDDIMSSIADVNRADPSLTTKLQSDDYGNIANEMSQFVLDPTRGLEQMYAIIGQVTGGNHS